MACGTLSNATLSCTTKPTSGVYNKLYFMSLENYQEATKNESSGVITSITLPAGGEQAYYWESRDNGFQITVGSKKEDTGAITYPTSLVGYLESRSQSTNDLIKYLSNNRVVVIARLRGGDDENSFKILGANAGLTAEVNEFDTSASNGSFKITLANPTTPIENNEPELPLNFWDTDLTTTNASLETLLIPTT